MCSRSGRGFVFSAEALIAILCFAAFIAALSSVQPEDYSGVVLYKQAGDYAQIAMKQKCEHNSTCLAALRGLIGRNAEGDKCAVVVRTAVGPEMQYEDIEFKLCV